MFIELIHPQLKDINKSTDRLKIRLAEPEQAVNGRLWLTLTYDNIDDAVKEIGRVYAALLGVKDGKISTEYTGVNTPVKQIPRLEVKAITPLEVKTTTPPPEPPPLNAGAARQS